MFQVICNDTNFVPISVCQDMHSSMVSSLSESDDKFLLPAVSTSALLKAWHWEPLLVWFVAHHKLKENYTLREEANVLGAGKIDPSQKNNKNTHIIRWRWQANQFR